MTTTVTDELGQVHVLERPLGRGGQGEVWLVEGGRRVVKLLARKGDREALRRQIAMVKRLPLKDLHVARPLASLRPPHTGYVAEFLEDMVPIRTLMLPPKGPGRARWYHETGGLRRRLRLLAHAGEALSGLHAQGLVYGDVSHTNVFVSGPTSAMEAWLIDLDNLRYDSEPGRSLFTPGYGAPEVVDGSRGATSFSDAWALAVLAFRVLTLVHPFQGDLVENGEPELEEEADAGRLPWVEHPSDLRNRSTQGFHPRKAVLTKKLLELAGKTFEEGVREPMKRASVSEWTESLHRAADITVTCVDCKSTFLVTQQSCLFCDASRPALSYARIYRWEPERGIVQMGSRREGDLEHLPLTTEPLSLRARHTHAESGMRGRREAVHLEPVDHGVRVRPNGIQMWFTEPGKSSGAPRPIPERGMILPIPDTPEKSHVVHFEPVATPHRVITFNRGSQ